MPDKHLPIYAIKDFNPAPQREQYFYCSRLSRHLQMHLFIQKPHKHNFYILLFISQGTGTHTIDFEQYTVKPNTVFFLTPGQVHSWQLSDDTEGFILFFSPDFYLLDFPIQKLQRFPFFHAPLRSPSLHLSEAAFSHLLPTIEKLQTEYAQQQFLKDDMLRSYLDVLLIQLTRLYQLDYPDDLNTTAPIPYLQSVEMLIEANYKTHQPVSFYADKLHITPRQLNEYCKRILGKTTTELIHDRIILEAKRLLVHSDLTIAQVAAELGYSESAYFFRFFKKKTNYTPEQFRKEHV